MGGGIGAFIGTIFLANLPLEMLSLVVGSVVLFYIVFKLYMPSWRLVYKNAKKLFFPLGMLGGIIQGTSGISAPVSITFLNAMKLSRETFIPTISVYFMTLSFFQTPALIYYELLNYEIILLSIFCTFILLCSMPIGSRMSKSISVNTFDKLILILLGIIICKIFIDLLLK